MSRPRVISDQGWPTPVYRNGRLVDSHLATDGVTEGPVR